MTALMSVHLRNKAVDVRRYVLRLRQILTKHIHVRRKSERKTTKAMMKKVTMNTWTNWAHLRNL